MADPIIQVQNVWKKFKIPHEKRTTLFERTLGLLGGRKMTYEEFWALRQVTLNVLPGEWIGVIGENGSGKTTLLKVIAKITPPTIGTVAVRGTIAPILQLGVAFHPELTVKENVSLYSSILGITGSQVRERLQAILSFAELERFVDMKLKNLSSGMEMRLGFAVAIETDPDIFIIDEALAVGDLEFQRKCLDRFSQYVGKKTGILVTHSMGLLRQFCQSAVILSRGEIVDHGPTEQMATRFEMMSAANRSIEP
jgi:lipopolysaccharide transport system ATP-binding protein